jgi:putative ABC transport system permease protein
VLCYEGSGATDQSIEQIHASECVHLGLWVELDSPQDRSAYQEFLNNYVEEQRKLGRFPRTWEVSNMMTLSDWIEDQELAIKDTKVMIWLAISFLFICLLNTAVLLFGKLTQKRTEASLRRAVGASKQDLVIQYITEALLIGIFGGVLGIIFTYLGMLTMSFTYGEKLTRLISFDPYLVMTTVIVAVISTIAAGFIPAWKASTVAPATQLKSN